MYRKVLLSKIHRATITQADLHYEGSITLPPELLEASGIREYEAVNVWNVTSGTRFETYAITGRPGRGEICVNGAAAHMVTPGDLVIIARFGYMSDDELTTFEPKLVFVDENNQIKELRKEVPGPEEPPRVYRV
ncbi:MAG: aspartate 1-decarboxylase [Bdellovibrionales bacterium]|nr:aspartate 1-decarboxylase [Bdellovibrionales bacterium]